MTMQKQSHSKITITKRLETQANSVHVNELCWDKTFTIIKTNTFTSEDVECQPVVFCGTYNGPKFKTKEYSYLKALWSGW